MDRIFKRNDPTWIAHWINILTNRSRGGNGFLVAMGTSTTAGLIFPPKHFRRLHRILIVPAPKIRPYPTEIRVLFPSRKPRVSFTLSPIFFFSPFLFIYFAYTRFNDPPRCSGREKSNIVIESFHYEEIFFSIEGNVRTSFSFPPPIVIYYVKSIIKTRFLFLGEPWTLRG